MGKAIVFSKKVIVAFLAAVVLVLAAACSDGRNADMGAAESSGKPGVAAVIPEGYDCKVETVPVEMSQGEKAELEVTNVDIGRGDATVDVVVGGKSYLEWGYGMPWRDYVDSSVGGGAAVSWSVPVAAREGTVLVQGTPAFGGETSGDVFVPIGDDLIWLHVRPSGDVGDQSTMFSEFLRSAEFETFAERLEVE